MHPILGSEWRKTQPECPKRPPAPRTKEAAPPHHPSPPDHRPPPPPISKARFTPQQAEDSGTTPRVNRFKTSFQPKVLQFPKPGRTGAASPPTAAASPCTAAASPCTAAASPCTASARPSTVAAPTHPEGQVHPTASRRLWHRAESQSIQDFVSAQSNPASQTGTEQAPAARFTAAARSPTAAPPDHPPPLPHSVPKARFTPQQAEDSRTAPRVNRFKTSFQPKVPQIPKPEQNRRPQPDLAPPHDHPLPPHPTTHRRRPTPIPKARFTPQQAEDSGTAPRVNRFKTSFQPKVTQLPKPEQNRRPQPDLPPPHDHPLPPHPTTHRRRPTPSRRPGSPHSKQKTLVPSRESIDSRLRFSLK